MTRHLDTGAVMTSVNTDVSDKILLTQFLRKHKLILVHGAGDDLIAAPQYLFPGLTPEESVIKGLGSSSEAALNIPVSKLTFVDLHELRDSSDHVPGVNHEQLCKSGSSHL